MPTPPLALACPPSKSTISKELEKDAYAKPCISQQPHHNPCALYATSLHITKNLSGRTLECPFFGQNEIM